MSQNLKLHRLNSGPYTFVAIENHTSDCLRLIRVLTKNNLVHNDVLLLPSHIDDLPINAIGWQITNVMDGLHCSKIVIPETINLVQNASFGPMPNLREIDIKSSACEFRDTLKDVTEFDEPGTSRQICIRCNPGSQTEMNLKHVDFNKNIDVEIRTMSRLKEALQNIPEEEEER